MIAKPVIKEVALPGHTVFGGHELFPILHHRCHAWLVREREDGVQMIRHEQAQAAMPDEFVVVMFHRRDDGVADCRTTELVSSRRHTFDGDEELTALGHPFGNRVGNSFAGGQIHVRNVNETGAMGQLERRR